MRNGIKNYKLVFNNHGTAGGRRRRRGTKYRQKRQQARPKQPRPGHDEAGALPQGALISLLFVRSFFTSSPYPWLAMMRLNCDR